MKNLEVARCFGGHLTRSGTAGISQEMQQSMSSDLKTSIQEVMWPFFKTETYSEETNKYLYQDTKDRITPYFDKVLF